MINLLIGFIIGLKCNDSMYLKFNFIHFLSAYPHKEY